jgi:glucokinase
VEARDVARRPWTGGTQWAIGLDVGGTKMAAGLVALPSGMVVGRQIVRTAAQRGGEAVLADALALVEGLLGEAAARGLAVAGIGVGVAELVDLEGRVRSAATIEWRDMAVQAAFERLAPAVVESDVRAGALAEAISGAGRDYGTFVYVTVGTGISYSLVQEGRPYAGARGNALVLSSGALTTTCPRCGTTTDFVLEEFAAGPALVARYNAARQSGAPAGGAAAGPARKARQAQDVLAAAGAGDGAAMAVVRSAGEALGNSVGFLINVLDPQAVVVGGGLGLAGGLYWTSFVEATRAHIWAEETRNLAILPAALGTDAGLIGAAAAIWGRRGGGDGGPRVGTVDRKERTGR